jgi:hypothetical protein
MLDCGAWSLTGKKAVAQGLWTLLHGGAKVKQER